MQITPGITHLLGTIPTMKYQPNNFAPKDVINKLPLQAAKKIVTVMVRLPYEPVIIKYALIRRAVLPFGSESKANEMFRTDWEKINRPPRAVLDGVAGEIIRSVQANACLTLRN